MSQICEGAQFCELTHDCDCVVATPEERAVIEAAKVFTRVRRNTTFSDQQAFGAMRVLFYAVDELEAAK